MREGLRAKDSKIPEAELEAIMANADVNGDGKVDYEEFLAATMHLGKLEREEHLYKAFKVSSSLVQRCLSLVAVCACAGSCFAQPFALLKQQAVCVCALGTQRRIDRLHPNGVESQHTPTGCMCID